jgi:hypothetical protein
MTLAEPAFVLSAGHKRPPDAHLFALDSASASIRVP